MFDDRFGPHVTPIAEDLGQAWGHPLGLLQWRSRRAAELAAGGLGLVIQRERHQARVVSRWRCTGCSGRSRRYRGWLEIDRRLTSNAGCYGR